MAGLVAEGIAAAILERLGLTAEAISDSGRHLFGPPLPATNQVPPMSAEAKCVLDAAAHIARPNAPDDNKGEARVDRAPVGVLALDPGSRARRIVNDLDVAIAAIKRELNCEITLNPRRRRRHGGKFRLSWLRVTITMRIDVGLFNGARLRSARLPR